MLLDRLATLGPSIAGERDPERLVQRIVDEAAVLVGAAAGAFLTNGGTPGAELVLAAATEPASKTFEEFLHLQKDSLVVATWTDDATLRCEDVTQDPRYRPVTTAGSAMEAQPSIRSYVAAQVKSIDGEVMGALCLGHSKAGVFDEAAERALSALAPMAGTALSNARLFSELSRQKAELTSSEARYRLVSEAMQEGVWYWDVPTNRVEWNDRLLELMGVARASWGGTFEDWFARLHPEDQPRLIEALKAHLEHRVPYRVDLFRLRHENGMYRWCMTAGQAEWDESGRPLRMAGSFRDVTDRKLSQDRLEESELRFAQILDSIQDMVFTKNDRLQVTWANAAACRYYGATVEELRGITGKPYNAIDFAHKYHADDREVFETGRTVERSEEQNLAPWGEVRTFHTVKTPIKNANGRVIELVGVSRDITTRKRELDAQRLLAQASAILGSSIEYETTLANVARATVPTFSDWCAVDMLESDGSLHRLAVHHGDPARVALAHQLHEKYPPDLRAEHGLGHVLRTCQVEFVTEITDDMIRAGARDAEHLEHLNQLGLRSYIVAPIIVGERAAGAISFVSAESKRRYGEADVDFVSELARRAAVAIENAKLYRQVRELALTLEQRVQERTAELRDSNRELEAFSYTVSHDLRAPVRHIGGFVDLLRESAGEQLGSEALRYLDTIKSAATQMGTLIDGLLAFSRLGRAQLHKRPVDLAAVVKSVLEELEPDMVGRHIDWNIGQLPTVLADATMLRLVMTNLIANAIKYTSSKSRAHISIGAVGGPDGQHQAREVMVWVEDDGVGFDMQYVDKLFGVFQRLHGEAQFEGTGIGLATVRRIIRRHGGRTWAKGVLGSGATFYFTLPTEEDRHE